MEYNDESLFQGLQRCCLKCRAGKAETEGQCIAEALFNFDSRYVGFAGHFPGTPVLPAIVQMVAVRFTAEQVLGRKLYPLYYSRTKFRGMIVPGERVELGLNLTIGDGTWKGTFTIRKMADDRHDVASGNCGFTDILK